MTGTVYIVGSVNEDLRFTVREHVRPGETIPVLSSGSELGGKGANQAIAAGRAGARVRFIGAVGNDERGRALREQLAAEGIDVQDVLLLGGLATGRAVVMVDEAGQNAILIDAGANGAVAPAQVRAALSAATEGDVVLCQLETGVQGAATALREGRARGATTVLNAAPFDPGIVPALDDVDLIIVNEHEQADLAAALTRGGDGAGIRRFAGRVLCTLGAEGSVLEDGSAAIRIPGERVSVVDTTGAGDTYVGYLVARMAAGSSLTDAMRAAGRAASIAVGREGAARAIPFAADLDL